MAMIKCEHCDTLSDDDYNPHTDIEGELVCESCAQFFDDVVNDAVNSYKGMTAKEKVKHFADKFKGCKP